MDMLALFCLLASHVLGGCARKPGPFTHEQARRLFRQPIPDLMLYKDSSGSCSSSSSSEYFMTQCPAPPSSESINCCRRGVKSTVDAFYNFQTTPIEVGYDNELPWNYDVINGAWANNGNITEGGSNFSSTTEQVATYPLVIYGNATYPIHQCDDLQVTVQMRYNTLRVLANGNRVVSQDIYERNPYYGSGLFEVYDLETSLYFGFVMTNTAIYALYARMPPSGAPAGTPQFTYAVPIYVRQNSLNFYASLNYETLQFVFSGAKKTVRWRVNGDDRFLLDQVGRRLDPMYSTDLNFSGTDDLVYPKCIQIRLGILGLQSLYPTPVGICYGLYLYCDCQESPYETSRMRCSYLTPPGNIFNSLEVTMQMWLKSLAVNRVFDINPVCGCGQQRCLPLCQSTSSSSSGETCHIGCPDDSSSTYSDPWAYQH